MSTKTRFEEEAKGNSEMAYWFGVHRLNVQVLAAHCSLCDRKNAMVPGTGEKKKIRCKKKHKLVRFQKSYFHVRVFFSNNMLISEVIYAILIT